MVKREVPSLSEWKSINMRLTAFPSLEDSFDGQEWWDEVTGIAPDTKVEQAQTSEKILEGVFQNGNLTLSLLPRRINWTYAAVGEQVLRTGEIPELGLFEEQVKVFEGIMKPWLENKSPSLVRLAFGAQIIQRVSSHQEAYERLAAYLPIEIDGSSSSDFLYRINRKRPSQLDIEGLEINRLSTWSALRFQGSIHSSASPRQRRTLERYACLLELDINTVPEFAHDFKAEILGDLFSELIALGIEIAEKGDIA